MAMLPVLAVSLTALVLTSGTANALAWPNDPPAPTTPFPALEGKPDPTICLLEQAKIVTAQKLYDTAKQTYDTQVKLVLAGSGAVLDVTVAQDALNNVGIQLNDAKYAYATCQNTNANPVPVNQACITIGLELNRLKDKLAIIQNLQDTAQWRVDSAKAIAAQGLPGSDTQLTAAEAALTVAQAQTKEASVALDAQRTVATKKGCANAERPAPAPAPPAPPNPAPVGATPSDTSTDTSTDMPTDMPTDPSTSMPSDTATGAPSDLPTDSATSAPTDASSNPPTDAPSDSASPASSAS
jgi:hypothetical protein